MEAIVCQANVCPAARNVPNQQRRRRKPSLLNSADAKRTGVSDRLSFKATHPQRRAYSGAAINFKQEILFCCSPEKMSRLTTSSIAIVHRPWCNQLRAFYLLLAVAASCSFAVAQQPRIVSPARPLPAQRAVDTLGDPPAPPILRRNPARVVADFVTVEAQLRAELNRYTFKRDVVLQTIGPNGEVTGDYIRNSQFTFDDRGNRSEQVLYHPKSTINEMRITREDIQDLAGAQLLGIDVLEPVKYQLTYAGRETIGDRNTYAIDIAPQTTPDPHRMSERFFVGRVWIDPTNLQIVKVRGSVEPHGKQRFPLFETLRELTGAPFLVPTRTEADDILRFPNRSVHYRIKVRYYDYKRFASKVVAKEISGPAPN